MFQFQLGAIGSSFGISSSPSVIVSIPAWCDWEDEVKLPGKMSGLMFQFQLGAIGRVLFGEVY